MVRNSLEIGYLKDQDGYVEIEVRDKLYGEENEVNCVRVKPNTGFV
jgi:hypothetical protein